MVSSRLSKWNFRRNSELSAKGFFDVRLERITGSGRGSGSINIDVYPESFDERDVALMPLNRDGPSPREAGSKGWWLATL